MTGEPGILQPMALQRVRHDLVTEQQQTHYKAETKVTYETFKYKPLYPLYTTSCPYFSITSDHESHF